MTDDSLSDDVFVESMPPQTLASASAYTAAQYLRYPDDIAADTDDQNLTTRTASPTGYPGYRPPMAALRLYGLTTDVQSHDASRTATATDTVTGTTKTANGGGVDDGWQSYRIEEDFDDAVAHKTILLGDSGVGKTSFLVMYNTGEFRAGSFSATVGIALTVMILGDSGVGKTCLLVRFRDGTFLSGNFISTVGIDFRNKIVTVDQTRVKLQIWDTAGQERFRSVTHAYYRDAHALLLLYDVTNKITFDNTRAWLVEINEYAQDDVVIMLLGNKADCGGSDRQVRREDGERLAKEYNVAFMETSAKTGLNVELAFLAVGRQLKSRKSNSSDEAKFNVQDYVKEHTQKQTCPPCNL